MDFVRVRRPQNLEAHALRFIVSFFNTVVSALGVFLFWLIITKMVSSLFSAAVVTLLYAFGTLTWPYSGTFLSEPLAVLFVLISFYLLISDVGPGKALLTSRFLSGLSLGIAAAAHIAAILFAPFFSLLSGWFRRYDVRKKRIHLPALACLLGGLVLALAPLGCYNYARFGAFLETGRTVSPDYASKFLYGQFVPPWQGIYGLLLSGGKGLLFYCPAVVAGILCWGKFHRKYASLSIVLASAIVFRMIFIASRSDWHGGFCLGPRYLLMIIPFLLIGIGIWLDEQLQAGQVRSVRLFLGFAAACVAQQVYFCIGEIFSYLHLVRWAALFETGVNLIENDRLYLSWSDSPLFYLLREKRGPWLLQQVPLSNEVLWVVSTLLVLLILAFVLHCAFRYTQSAQAESSEQANNELKLAG